VIRVLVQLLLFIVALWAFLDIVQTPSEQVRVLPKPVWLLLCLVPLLGPVAWFTMGRSELPQPRRTLKRPVAPDDDPDFLRHLGGPGPGDPGAR
jgi:hypothetical protein